LAPGAAITTGQVLTVPGLRLHVSVLGQTGARIADLNGVSLTDLRRVNPGLSAGILPAGTRVIIPVH
jgi:hypothetical protein